MKEFFNSPAHLKHAKAQAKTLTSVDVGNHGHGRQEKRVVLATDSLDIIDKKEREEWLGLESSVCEEAHRKDKITGIKSIQKRYYIISHEAEADKLLAMIRQHWTIENQCHWLLDVTFNEDQCRVRKGNAPNNLAMLRKVTLSLLKQDTSIKDTIRGNRYPAALD